jgi:hypothetical protein
MTTFMMVGTGQAAIPTFINFQALLTDSNGTAVPDGNYEIAFSIWDGDDVDTDTKLWEETHMNVSVQSGNYCVSLGSIVPFSDPDENGDLSDGLTFSIPYYLGIRVESDTYMKEGGKLPAFTSVASAFRARTAGGRLICVKTVNYTLSENDDIVFASGNIQLTLPSAVNVRGRLYTVKKTDASGTTITIATIGGETIDGSATKQLSEADDALTVASDGSNWETVGSVVTTIGTAKLADDAVTSAKISDGTVAEADLAANAVTTAKIANASVTTAKIADAGVTEDKLEASLIFDDGDLLNLSNINGSGTGEGLVLPQASDVSAATAEGQISWDTDNDILYVGDGLAARAMGDITSVVAGSGLSSGGTSGDVTLDVNADNSTIEINSDTLRVKDGGITSAKLGLTSDVEFEGATPDDNETTVAVTDPTADRIITFPDATGTVALTSDITLPIRGSDVEVGDSASAGTDGVAVGVSASTTQPRSVAVGKSASANTDSVAVGHSALATGSYAVAVGRSALGNDNGVAVGYQTDAHWQGTAIGYKADSDNNGAAVGWMSIGHHNGAAVGFRANGSSYGVALGSDAMTNSEHYAIAKGAYSQCTRYNEEWKTSDGANNKFGYGQVNWHGTASGASELFLGGTADERFVLQDNSVVSFQILVSGVDTITGDSAGWNITGAIKRRSGAGTTALVLGAPSMTGSWKDIGWADPAVSADTINGALKLTVTGTGNNCLFNATMTYSEVRE